MHIPLTIRNYANGPKPFVELHLNYSPKRGRRSYGIISAFIDTGSADTFLSMTDAVRLGIKPVGEGRKILIGGYAVKLHDLKNVKMRVMGEDNKTVFDISLPKIGLTIPYDNSKKSVDNARSLPSILGTDLLSYHKLGLWFDIANDESYLQLSK